MNAQPDSQFLIKTPFEELEKELIGQGAFGKIYKITYNHLKFAAKVVDLSMLEKHNLEKITAKLFKEY